MNIIYVELLNNSTGKRKLFRFDNAVALLIYEQAIKVSCWVLPGDSNYTFTDGKLIKGASDYAHQGAEAPTGDNQGEAEEVTA